MNELNEEIKLTLNLMQTGIHDTTHDVLQDHLYYLLEIKRNELQQRLVERSWFEPVKRDQAPYKSVKIDGQIADEAKPLTTEELKAGGWWCADVSEECAIVFKAKGLKVFNWENWGDDCYYNRCILNNIGSVARATIGSTPYGSRQIKRINGDFYWGDK